MAQSMSSLISLVLLLPLLVTAAPAPVSSEANISSAVNSVASIPVPSAASGSASVPLPSGISSGVPSAPIQSGVSAVPSAPIPSGVSSESAPLHSGIPVHSGVHSSHAHPSAVPSDGACHLPPAHSSEIKPSNEPTLPPIGVPKPSGTGVSSIKESGVPSVKGPGASSAVAPISSGLPKPSLGVSSALESGTAVKSDVASALPSSAAAVPSQGTAIPGESSSLAIPAKSSVAAAPSVTGSAPVVAPSVTGSGSAPIVSASGTMSAPLSTPSGTGNFTFDAGCTALTVAEVESLPGWNQLKTEAEKNWGTGQYNVVTNDKDFPKNVAEKCAGKTGGGQVAKGWVWFQYLETVKGHYKWALEIDSILSDETQRKLPGGK